MGRIRTIKPEFPQSESIGRVPRESRLLFILLWTQADDEGRLRGNSRMLASLLYPYDEDAPSLLEEWLKPLEQESMVRRYSVEGNAYVEVLNFKKHQKIDRPSTSKLPPFEIPREESSSPRENSLSIKEGIKENICTGTNGNGAHPPDSVDARIISETVGIFGMREQADMMRLVSQYAATSRKSLEGILEQMGRRWEEYQNEVPNLEWTYGSSYKFFMSGNWDKPDSWPRKQKSRNKAIEEWEPSYDGERAS